MSNTPQMVDRSSASTSPAHFQRHSQSIVVMDKWPTELRQSIYQIGLYCRMWNVPAHDVEKIFEAGLRSYDPDGI